MSSTGASLFRGLVGAACALVGVALYAGCGSSDGAQSLGSEAGSAGEAGESGLVTWCEAYKVINCSCQQCHQSPPLNGAPIPLLTYADTQKPFPNASSTSTVWQEMQEVVSNDTMPLLGTDATPPVKALTDEQRTMLLDWLAQGAQDSGGQACPDSCTWAGAK